jgi:hypothetical protein
MKTANIPKAIRRPPATMAPIVLRLPHMKRKWVSQAPGERPPITRRQFGGVGKKQSANFGTMKMTPGPSVAIIYVGRKIFAVRPNEEIHIGSSNKGSDVQILTLASRHLVIKHVEDRGAHFLMIEACHQMGEIRIEEEASQGYGSRTATISDRATFRMTASGTLALSVRSFAASGAQTYSPAIILRVELAPNRSWGRKVIEKELAAIVRQQEQRHAYTGRIVRPDYS